MFSLLKLIKLGKYNTVPLSQETRLSIFGQCGYVYFLELQNEHTYSQSRIRLLKCCNAKNSLSKCLRCWHCQKIEGKRFWALINRTMCSPKVKGSFFVCFYRFWVWQLLLELHFLPETRLWEGRSSWPPACTCFWEESKSGPLLLWKKQQLNTLPKNERSRRAGIESKKYFIVTTRAAIKRAAGSIGDSVPVYEEAPQVLVPCGAQVNVLPPLVREVTLPGSSSL